MIKEEEEKLFNEWKLIRPGFCPDGIVEEQNYLDSNPKIMFVLKEVNKEFNLKDKLKNPEFKRKFTWDNIARWTYGIKNLDKDIQWIELEKNEFITKIRKELLSTICIINIKKSYGGYKTDINELKKIAEQDKIFLKNQFQIYYKELSTRPDLIICCGTSKIFNRLVDIPDKNKCGTTSKGIKYIRYDNNKFLILYHHPEARVKDNLLFYGLIDAIKELLITK